MWAVICADGKDRLGARHDTERAAFEDAGYFTQHSTCRSWTECGSCPGGTHGVERVDWNGFAAGVEG